jgi:hypothetical protein
MKIAVITLSCAYNYGAVLQAYALYKHLREQGYQVTLIDYITERYDIDARNYVYRSTTRWRKNAATRLLWKYTRHRCELKLRNNFRSFLIKNVSMTHTYYSNEELKNDPIDADVFVTGSDQIWNTDFSWDKKIDKPYFLDFVPDNITKVAYSSSFGKIELNAEEMYDIKECLARFNMLSVREESGRKIIEKLGMEATVVADPTLLWGQEIWSALAAERQVAEPYLLLFQVFPDEELMKLAEKIAVHKKLRLVIVSPNPMDKRKIHRKAVYLPTVEEWLSYFEYADFIMTDSFHATSFSTIFERQFLVSTRAKYDSRITGYLNVLGISERAISNMDYDKGMDIAGKPIDFEVTTRKRREFISFSLEWLEQALGFL